MWDFSITYRSSLLHLLWWKLCLALILPSYFVIICFYAFLWKSICWFLFWGFPSHLVTTSTQILTITLSDKVYITCIVLRYNMNKNFHGRTWVWLLRPFMKGGYLSCDCTCELCKSRCQLIPEKQIFLISQLNFNGSGALTDGVLLSSLCRF